jgi:hypothetical protein
MSDARDPPMPKPSASDVEGAASACSADALLLIASVPVNKMDFVQCISRWRAISHLAESVGYSNTIRGEAAGLVGRYYAWASHHRGWISVGMRSKCVWL